MLSKLVLAKVYRSAKDRLINTEYRKFESRQKDKFAAFVYKKSQFLFYDIESVEIIYRK